MNNRKVKKVLIIAYYWPPAGGPGVQRVVKFTKFLRDFNFEPIILTVENGSYPAFDYSLIKELPENIKVIKTKTFEPFSIYKKLLKQKDGVIPKDVFSKTKNESAINKVSKWIRANIFIPDGRVGWLPFLISAGNKIIQNEKPDIIFSTSPPNSLHLGAKYLAKKHKLKWVADFRDPWTDGYWNTDLPKLNFMKKVDLKFEKAVLKKASAITTVSAELVFLFKEKEENNFFVLHNGFEKKQFYPIKSDVFRILFIGNLTKFQNPEPLFKAINKIENINLFDIEINFTGKTYSDFSDLIQKYSNLNIVINDYLPRNKLMEFGNTSSLLFFPTYAINKYSKGIIGAKMFDYLALRKPILAVGEKGSIVDRVLSETNSGRLFCKDEIENISKFITEKFQVWKEKKYISLDWNENLDKYLTEKSVKKITDIFLKLLSEK